MVDLRLFQSLGEPVERAAQRQTLAQQPFRFTGQPRAQGRVDRQTLEDIALGMAAAQQLQVREDAITHREREISVEAQRTRGRLSAAAVALQAEHGSMTDRFSSFIERFNSLRDRWNALNEQRHARARELAETRGRRLAEMPVHPDKLYDALEHAQAKRARRLTEADDAVTRTGVLELPESHALSWLHDIVDWRALGASASHLFDVEQRRVHARGQGYSVEEAVRLHPTGWSWFDNPDYAHSTAIGDAGRRLRHRVLHGADPPWHNDSLHARISNRASHPKHGMARRALESIFEGTVAAPFSFYGEVLATGLYVPPTDASFWEASLRYIVGSTVGCYFTAPVEERSRTQGGDSDGESEDGEAIKILRPSAEKMCFPACASPPALCRALGRQRLPLAWQGRT